MELIAFDIETMAMPPSEAALAEKMKKLGKEYVKEATIAEKLLKWQEDEFCFDAEGARPICASAINIRSGQEWVFASDDSEEVAQQFWVHIGKMPKMKLVGFNCKKFDLPIMIRWGLKSDIRLLNTLGRYDVVDLIKDPLGWDMGLKSLAWYARVFDCGEKSGSGADVAGLWLDGKEDEVKQYCLQDTRITAELYRKLSRFYTL